MGRQDISKSCQKEPLVIFNVGLLTRAKMNIDELLLFSRVVNDAACSQRRRNDTEQYERGEMGETKSDAWEMGNGQCVGVCHPL